MAPAPPRTVPRPLAPRIAPAPSRLAPRVRQGLMSLYNGFWPNFGRVVPRVTIVFIVMEQLKKLMD